MPRTPSFADRVRWLRARAGLSQSQLAAKASLASRSVSRIELSEGGTVSAATMIAFARAFGVDAQWLADGGPGGPIDDAELALWCIAHPPIRRGPALPRERGADNQDLAMAEDVLEIVSAAETLGISAHAVLSAIAEHGGPAPSKELLRGVLLAFRSLSITPTK